MIMKKTMIVPCLSKTLNKVFDHNEANCAINCVYAISEMDVTCFDEIYFVVLAEMDEKYHLTEKICADMGRLLYYKGEFKVLRLPNMTSSPAETVYRALQAIGAKDRTLFIKDGDNLFYNQNIPTTNAIITASLEEQTLVDPIHKSYVHLDEQGFITNAIEKRVISDQFIAGGYSFSDAKKYVEAYEELKKISNKFYISDVIFWLILNKNEKFLPVRAKEFTDFNI